MSLSQNRCTLLGDMHEILFLRGPLFHCGTAGLFATSRMTLWRRRAKARSARLWRISPILT